MRRAIALIVLAMAGVGGPALLSGGSGAVAQVYPSRPVKLIIPFPPGGVPDIAGRVIALSLSERLGQQVIVDNRGGAAGTLGVEAAAKSPADGYTLLIGTTGTLASAPNLYPNLGYDPLRSFTPISLLTSAPFIIVIHPSLPARSLDELIGFARSRAGQLNFGSVGNGSPPHIAGEMFKIAAGVDLVHVPYKGLPAAMSDLVGGRIHIMFNQLAPYRSHILAGQLKALAIAASGRLTQLPEVPTTAEAGLPGYEVSIWTGLLAPRATPDEVVAKLNAEVRKVLLTKEVRDSLAGHGFDAAGSSPEQFSALIVSDSAKWSRAIKASGAKLD